MFLLHIARRSCTLFPCWCPAWVFSSLICVAAAAVAVVAVAVAVVVAVVAAVAVVGPGCVSMPSSASLSLGEIYLQKLSRCLRR